MCRVVQAHRLASSDLVISSRANLSFSNVMDFILRKSGLFIRLPVLYRPFSPMKYDDTALCRGCHQLVFAPSFILNHLD